MSAGAILVVGEALADLVPRDGEATAYEALLGGSGFNTALAAARCGARVLLGATLSRDALGRRFRRTIEQEGIGTAHLGDSEAPTPLALVEPLGADGVADYVFHLAPTALDEPPPLPERLDGIVHLHLTSFGATTGTSGNAALALMRRARAAGISISYDLNIRPKALPPPAEARLAIEERVALCDLVKLSGEDAYWFDPGGFSKSRARWLAAGLPITLETAGDHGADLFRASLPMISAFLPASELIDTIGAGDALMGAFLASLAQNGGLGPALRAIDEGVAASAMDFACAVAAETCGRRGCDPPRGLPPEAC